MLDCTHLSIYYEIIGSINKYYCINQTFTTALETYLEEWHTSIENTFFFVENYTLLRTLIYLRGYVFIVEPLEHEKNHQKLFTD